MNTDLYELFIQGLTSDEVKRFVMLSPKEQEQVYNMWNSWMMNGLVQDLKKIACIA